MIRKITSIIMILGVSFQFLIAQNYELPPTKRSYGSVPVISDEAME